MMATQITYSPWVPRDGMTGFFRHLVEAWGDPNTNDGLVKWPSETLEVVCERSDAHALVYETAVDRLRCWDPV